MISSNFRLLIALLIQSVFSENCGKIFENEEFFLQSENYPHQYPLNKECFYLLKGNNCTKYFKITYLDLDLEESVGCVKNRLEIGAQDALCGSKRSNSSKFYKTENGILKIKFLTYSNANSDNNRRGFKLKISQINYCDDESVNENEKTSSEENFDTTQFTKIDLTTQITPKFYYLPPKPQECCKNEFSSTKSILLFSPNFPHSMSSAADCIYTIKKANSFVCRVRINILFFSLDISSCSNGYLEIDGKKLCGCNRELQLITSFKDSNEKKFLKFFSKGNRKSFGHQSGFVLEIMQDECQKTRNIPAFRYYNDQNNKIRWPTDNDDKNQVEKLKLVNERSFYLPAVLNKNSHNPSGYYYQHYYFYEPNNNEEVTEISISSEEENIENDKEDTEIIDLMSYNTSEEICYRKNNAECVTWNKKQFNALQNRYEISNWNKMCNVKETFISENNEEEEDEQKNCQNFSQLSGVLTSPGYPLMPYPQSANLCYHFKILPGYCAIKLDFKDFFIERSYDCLKDYLQINQKRYCGNYLANKQVLIQTKQGINYQDIYFITDHYYCMKGFYAEYLQIKCDDQEEDSKYYHHHCSHPDHGKKNNEDYDDEEEEKCEKFITDKFFLIKYNAKIKHCAYFINRYKPDVCEMRIFIDIPCNIGYISINYRKYCGNMRQLVTLNLLDTVNLNYTILNYPVGFSLDTNFLQGEQVECEYPDAARILLGKLKYASANEEKSTKST